MTVPFSDAPDLTESFVDQFNELQKQLERFRTESSTKTSTDTAQELTTLKSERDQLMAEKASLDLRLSTLTSQLKEETRIRNELQQNSEHDKNRIEELNRLVTKLREQPPHPSNPGLGRNPSPGPDVSELMLQNQTLQEEKNNWMRRFEDCNDELEQLKRENLE